MERRNGAEFSHFSHLTVGCKNSVRFAHFIFALPFFCKNSVRSAHFIFALLMVIWLL